MLSTTGREFVLLSALFACVTVCFGQQQRPGRRGIRSASAGQPVVRLLQNELPKGGYWALEPDPASDPTGQKRHGRLRATPPPQYWDLIDTQALPIMADWTSQQFDGYALFYFHDLRGTYDPKNSHRPQILEQGYPLDLYVGVTPPVFYADESLNLLTNPFNFDSKLQVYDLTLVGGESYTAQLLAEVPLLGGEAGFILDHNSTMTWGAPVTPGEEPAPTTFRVLFRYYPDGNQITHLDEGEIALFQGCNYQGKAAVFIANTPDFSKLTSSITSLDKSAASVKLGNNTAVTLYSGAGFTGTSQVIKTNTACLDSTPLGRQTTSIQVAPLLPLALSSKECENCQLQGIDATSLDLSSIDFTGADLTRATLAKTTLTNTVLNGATLTGAKLNGATFNNTKLIKATFDGALGLEGVDLSHNVVASGISLKGVNLTKAVLSGAQLDHANLTGATLAGVMLRKTNLQNATFDKALGLQGADLSVAQLTGASFRGADLTKVTLPTNFDDVDLTGATLTGVSLQKIYLKDSIFDGVLGLAGADLTQVSFSNTSLRHVNLSGAKLYGAQLNNANLDGSNLSGAYLTKLGNTGAANLSGAFLRNVNLSNAQLGGANFVNASFYGTVPAGQGTCAIDSQTGFTASCATASGATMNNTQFAGAYLFGVDFTGAQVQGVQFGNAVLAGANFAKATLSADSSVGTNSGFSYAFLEGTNLATAQFRNGISLADSFLDFSPQGNTMYLLLSGDHTAFPGYWGEPGKPVCAEMSYNGPLAGSGSLVPTQDPNIICPDGNSHFGGCGPASPDGSNPNWKSPVDIGQYASYQFDATYTKAQSPPICKVDPLWVPLNIAQRKLSAR